MVGDVGSRRVRQLFGRTTVEEPRRRLFQPSGETAASKHCTHVSLIPDSDHASKVCSKFGASLMPFDSLSLD